MKYEFVGKKSELTLEQKLEIINNVNEMDEDFLGFYPLENNIENIKYYVDNCGIEGILDAVSNGGNYSVQDDYMVYYEDDGCINSYSKSDLNFEIDDFFLDDYIDRTIELLNNGEDIYFDYELFQDMDEQFNADIYNALADVCFKYRNTYNREEIENRIKNAIEFFEIHFEEQF